ncbi:glycosyltransferase family 2 protein [Clostridium neuense]|uniref:Glycosyltransferase family 2 protein n=1 Tax=Clostridium neuense TaxID=1728934 RepID=A0ABW8TGT1_9CLOT
MSEPKVFIVILNYNTINDTLECITSLKNIDYINYEIVVVDNSETVDCYNLLKDKFNEYKIIRTDENLGYANGNNIGIKYALDNGADYICVLNNDVVVEENFLSKTVEVLNNNKDVGIAGPCICEYKDRSKVQCAGASISLYTGLTRRVGKGMSYDNKDKENMVVDFLGGACFVCKRQVFEKIGLIPENYFLFFEETEFCIRAQKAGYKLLCVYGSKVYHKGSATISKFGGLSYYFLNRNRVVFIKRNSNAFQKVIFSMYIFIEAIGRILIRREPKLLIKNLICGFKADINEVHSKERKQFIR